MPIYDISRTIAPDTAVWEGDSPFHYDLVLDKAQGASVNLTTLHMSPHTATHADAAFHFEAGGDHPATMPLEPFLGRAQVVTVQRQRGGILPDELPPLLAPVERLLLHSWVSELPDHQWPQDFPYPTPELIHWLADQGAVLLGVDMPSVDAYESKSLPCHHLLYAQGMRHLELLRLAAVPDGIYELIALPLKMAGVCGSPVRAILRA